VDIKYKITAGAAIATFLTAVATCVIAWQAREQTRLNEDMLDIFRNQLTVQSRALTLLSGTESKDDIAITEIERPGEETEKWILPYWLRNIGGTPVQHLLYHHSIGVSETVAVPTRSTMQKMHWDSFILPGLVLKCGQDKILRQQILDHQENGKTIWRHFFISYSDELGRKYGYQRTWKLRYELGKIPMWFSTDYKQIEYDE